MTVARWAIYTVLLALIPVLMRLLILVLAAPPAPIRWFSEGDVITFGLILVITNISALETGTQVETNWKTKQMGLSLLLIATFATLFAITCFQEIQPGLFKHDRLLYASLILSLVSVLYSYSIWNRVAATQMASRGSNNG
jgi:hypothetical protein